MSAEGKKKRGEAGASNAKNIPFRYGGSKCNVSTGLGRAERSSGATFLSAMALGMVVARMQGKALNLPNRAWVWADEAMDHCTVERPV